MIKVSHTLEEIRAQVVGIYHSSPYLEAGRQRAKMHVRRSLSRVMRHIPPARQYAADQRCEAFILDVESKLRSSAVDLDPMDMAVGLTGGPGIDRIKGAGLRLRTREGPLSSNADQAPLGGVSEVLETDSKTAATDVGEQGLTVRVEMRIAGETRQMLTKVIPDEEDPKKYVIATVDPGTEKLVQKIQRGAKRVVEQNEKGVWQVVY